MKKNLFKNIWDRAVERLADIRGEMWFGAKKPNPADKFFPLPNRIFSLGLEAGEILVYAYLMYCEDRKTFKCYPSYAKIGDAVGMSKNTVIKYVRGLEDKRLIETEHTTIRRKSDNKARNGNLMYHILPIQTVVDYYDERQMRKLREESEAANTRRLLEEYDRKHGRNNADSGAG